MTEIAHTSYKEPNHNSLHNENESLNQEKSSTPSVEDYINKQKNLLLSITDKDLHDQALEEYEKIKTKFEGIKGKVTGVAGLELADLHQEFERDVKGMERLDDNKLSKLVSKEEVKQLISYIHSQGQETEENFYSILSNMSDSFFQSIIIEFQDDTYFDDDDSLLKTKFMEKFVNHILSEHNNKIEQQEINELKNLDFKDFTSQDQVDYYIQHIGQVEKSLPKNESTDLAIIKSKLLDKDFIEDLIQKNINRIKADTEISKADTKVSKFQEKENNIDKTRSDFKENFTSIYENISNINDGGELLNKYPGIINILQEISNTSIDNTKSLDKLSKDLLNLLEKTDKNGVTVAEKFLQDLGKVNPELYSKTLDLFKNSSDTLKQNLSHLSNIYTEAKSVIPFPDGGDTEIYSALSPNAVISGDRAIDGNKYMDLSVEPPQKYIRLENGFRLNSTVKFPKIITEKEQEFKQESEILTQEISEGKTDYNNKEFRKNELLGAKAKLDNSETSTDEKNKLAVEYPNLEYELSQLTLELNQLDSDLNELETKLSELTKTFKIEHKQALDWYKKQAEAKDKKTEEVLKFLEGVGFNLIPQSITNSIIEQLNNPGNSGLRGLVGFNTILNLSEGDLGFQTSFNDDTLGTTEKVIFAEFLNRMISADAGKPIDVNKILNGGSVAVGDRTQLSIQLEQAGLKDSGTGIGVAMDNLRKSTLEK